jgi:EAL domain-containing protein (putative c-di-GMP-specific phosphodiesterase class I)
LTAPQEDYYRLRTEWLRYKSQLHDSLTGFPALPAVLEDVRRLLDDWGHLDVVYLDIGRPWGYDINLGWAAHDQAVRDLAALLSSLRETGEIGAHDVLCLHTVRSGRFLAFLAPEGAEARGRPAAARRERIVSALRRRLDDGPPSSPLRSMRLAAGHARMDVDSRVRAERTIQAGVTDAMFTSLLEREGMEAVRRDELHRMIVNGDVRTVFHPIVRLSDGVVIGHEALTRPSPDVSFDSVEELFAFAESTEMLVDFERLCRRTAIRHAARLPQPGLLFLNASALAVEDEEWSLGTEAALREAGLSPAAVVIEITERLAIVQHDAFQGALRTFKERGYRVAVDDMGAGYASLQSLASIEPDFLKFDVALVRDIDRSSIKRSLLESLRQLAEKIRARVIAEGIERREEMETLLDLGIELGQGFYFNREEVA